LLLLNDGRHGKAVLLWLLLVVVMMGKGSVGGLE
jgi:hypothetical protein